MHDYALEVTLMPMDTVCGMQVDEEDALTADYEGQTYYFHSEECREEFLEAPEDYMADTLDFITDEES
jgi:YHS domain-containing protein